MANLKLANRGTFYDGVVSISWAINEEESQVAEDPGTYSSQLKQAIAAGAVLETADDPTPEPEAPVASSTVRVVGTPTDGEVPVWNENDGVWEPSTAPGGAANLDDLGDVTITTVANDDIIQRKAGVWVNRTLAQLITDLTAGLSAIFAAVAHTHATKVPVNFVIDGGGSVITAGVKGFFQMKEAHTFTAWRLLGDPSGSIVVDIWRGSYADHVAGTIAAGDSICASNKPTLSTVRGNEDTSITDWLEAGSAGDVYWVNVEATPATVTKATLVLEYS